MVRQDQRGDLRACGKGYHEDDESDNSPVLEAVKCREEGRNERWLNIRYFSHGRGQAAASSQQLSSKNFITRGPLLALERKKDRSSPLPATTTTQYYIRLPMINR